MRIYDKYVKQHQEHIMDNKKKDPETIEELERQLKYMEKCQTTLKGNTLKKDYKVKVAKKNFFFYFLFVILDLHIERARKHKCESSLNKLNREI